jgi:hypothetical protein
VGGRSEARLLKGQRSPLGLKGEEFSLRRLYPALTFLAATAVTFDLLVAAQMLIGTPGTSSRSYDGGRMPRSCTDLAVTSVQR